MTSSTPGSRSGSQRSRGGCGPGPGLGSGGSASLTPLSPAAPSTSTAAAGAVFAPLRCVYCQKLSPAKEILKITCSNSQQQQDFQDGKQPPLTTDRTILHKESKEMLCVSTQHLQLQNRKNLIS